jgi:hypothetical protein
LCIVLIAVLLLSLLSSFSLSLFSAVLAAMDPIAYCSSQRDPSGALINKSERDVVRAKIEQVKAQCVAKYNSNPAHWNTFITESGRSVAEFIRDLTTPNAMQEQTSIVLLAEVLEITIVMCKYKNAARGAASWMHGQLLSSGFGDVYGPSGAEKTVHILFQPSRTSQSSSGEQLSVVSLTLCACSVDCSPLRFAFLMVLLCCPACLPACLPSFLLSFLSFLSFLPSFFLSFLRVISSHWCH